MQHAPDCVGPGALGIINRTDCFRKEWLFKEGEQKARRGRKKGEGITLLRV